MAMVILTRLDLLTFEQVARRDVEPAGYCLHQLIAGAATISTAIRIGETRSAWPGPGAEGSNPQVPAPA